MDLEKYRKEVILSAIADACWKKNSDHAMLRQTLEALLDYDLDKVSDEYFGILLMNMYKHHCGGLKYHNSDGRKKARIDFVKEVLDLRRNLPQLSLWRNLV